MGIEIESICELCNAKILYYRARKYCGHQSIKGSCAHKAMGKKAKLAMKRYAKRNKKRKTKENIDLTWLNQ